MIPVKFPLDAFLSFHQTSLPQHFPPTVTYIVKLNVKSVFIGWLCIITIETLLQKPLHCHLSFTGTCKDWQNVSELSCKMRWCPANRHTLLNQLMRILWLPTLSIIGSPFSETDEGEVCFNLLTQNLREKCPEAVLEAADTPHLTHGRAHPSKCLFIQ